MTDPEASHKDKLSASKLYGQSIGAFDKQNTSSVSGGAVYKWSDNTGNNKPVDAEIVSE